MAMPAKFLQENEVRLLDLAEKDPNDTLVLSEKERQILQLYDQLQELELERAILEASMTRTGHCNLLTISAEPLQMYPRSLGMRILQSISMRQNRSF